MKVVALGILVICLTRKNRDNKNTFGPKYPNFRVKIAHLHIFVPRPLRPIGASPVNILNTKEVSLRFPDMMVPKVLRPTLNIGFLAQKQPKLAEN